MTWEKQLPGGDPFTPAPKPEPPDWDQPPVEDDPFQKTPKPDTPDWPKLTIPVPVPLWEKDQPYIAITIWDFTLTIWDAGTTHWDIDAIPNDPWVTQ